MELHNKLKDYFTENGLQMKWFADKIGMSRHQIYQVIGGYAHLPPKYWAAVMKITKGKITLCDIIQDYFRDVEEVEVKESNKLDECLVSLKDFNTIT